MENQELKTGIFTALSEINKGVSAIGKNRKNKEQGFNFRGIDDVMNELHELFAANDVIIIPTVTAIDRKERASRTGGVLGYTLLTIEYRLQHIDGSFVTATVIGEGMDSGDKGTNKAMSIGLKYLLLQMFLIPTDEPKDPDSESPQLAPETGTQSTDPATLRQYPEDVRPWMSEIQFKKALERIVGGDTTVLDQAVKTFKIRKEYRTKLAEAQEMLTTPGEQKVSDGLPF